MFTVPEFVLILKPLEVKSKIDEFENSALERLGEIILPTML
jgi:hypothetical protein